MRNVEPIAVFLLIGFNVIPLVIERFFLLCVQRKITVLVTTL